MSATTWSMFTQFVITNYSSASASNNAAAIGLTFENWPVTEGSESGYLMLASQQIGGLEGSLGALMWTKGAPGTGSISPYLPQVTSDGTLITYQDLVAAGIGGSAAIFGLSPASEIVLAATQSGTAWSAGQVLPMNQTLSGCQSFVVSPDPTGTGSAQVVGLGSNGIPVVASVASAGTWTAGTGNLPLNSSTPTITAMTASLGFTPDVYHASIWYLFGLNDGTPYIVSYYDGNSWSAGAANGGNTYTSLDPYVPAAAYTSIVSFYAGTSLYLFGIAGGAPYLIATQDDSGAWESGQSLGSYAMSDVTFVSLVPAGDSSGNIVLFGLDADGNAWVAAWYSRTWGWSGGFAAPAIYEYGQQVAFSQLQPAGGSDGVLRCIGLGAQSGQLYEAGVWSPSGSLGAGQRRMPSQFSQNYSSARVLASQLMVTPAAQATFANNVAADLNAFTGTSGPFAMTSTASFIAAQLDPVSNIAVPSTPPDVFSALLQSNASNIAMWMGNYINVTAGTNWPSATTPQPIFITPNAAVYYGSYDLADLEWTFDDGVLTWQTPTEEQIGAGAPPVAGSLAFSLILPTSTNAGSYWGPSFSGTLEGTTGMITADTVQPPAAASVSSLTAPFTLSDETIGIGETFTATINIAAPAPYPGASVLMVSSMSWLFTPLCVIVPAGETSVEFTVGPFHPPFWESGNTTDVTLTAYLGGSSISATVTVGESALDEDAGGPDASSFTPSITPNPVQGGQSATLTITLTDVNPNAATNFNVVSDNAAADIASGSNTVVVGAGSSSQTTTLSTQIVGLSTNVLFSITNISQAGQRDQTDQVLEVLPLPPSALTVTGVTLAPSPVTGGNAVQATVQLNAVSSESLVITTTSSNNTLASWPATVTVPGGSSSVTVSLTTSAPSQITSVTLTAVNSQATASAISATLTVDIVPDVNALAVAPSPIVNADSAGLTATLAAASAQSVQLSASSNSPAITIDDPSTITIPAGVQTGDWSMSVNPPTIGDVWVTLTVTGAGSPETTQVDVLQNDPDAVTIAGVSLAGIGILTAAAVSIWQTLFGAARQLASSATSTSSSASDAAEEAEVEDLSNTIETQPPSGSDSD